MAVADLISGRYKLTESNNFDEFLAAIGVGYIKRKIVQSTSPEMEIIQEGDEEWRIITSSALSTSEVRFKLGEEFEEKRQDGVTVTSLVVAEGDKWVYTQKPGDGKDVISTREYKDTHLMVTNCIGDVTSTRTYERL